MSEWKIAYFGTSDKSTPLLKALEDNFNLKFVLTKTDTHVGRRQELRVPAVKVWADSKGIECIQVENLKSTNKESVINKLREERFDLVVVADFDFMIPESIFSVPKKGFINVHFSSLPKYRGASPVQHAILNNEKEIGITFQLLDKGMDTGKIVAQYDYELDSRHTTESLYNELFDKAAAIIPTVLSEYLEGMIEPKEQDHNRATYCYSKSNPKSTYIFKDDAKVDWKNMSALQIERMTKAFYPWPIVWSTLEDMNEAVFVATNQNPKNNSNPLLYLQKDIKLENTSILKPLRLKNTNPLRVKIYDAEIVKTPQGDALDIKTIQVEGKNKTEFKDFLNGYSLD